jgi:hypothetical protein
VWEVVTRTRTGSKFLKVARGSLKTLTCVFWYRKISEYFNASLIKLVLSYGISYYVILTEPLVYHIIARSVGAYWSTWVCSLMERKLRNKPVGWLLTCELHSLNSMARVGRYYNS